MLVLYKVSKSAKQLRCSGDLGDEITEIGEPEAGCHTLEVQRSVTTVYFSFSEVKEMPFQVPL